MDKEKLQTISNLFEEHEIRSVWDSEKEEYYFSVVDVIGALTESRNPRNYWNMLKKRMAGEEKSELYTKCVQLKMKSRDGKFYNTDTFDTKEILKLVEYVSSDKKEKFKLWLSNVGNKRLEDNKPSLIIADKIGDNRIFEDIKHIDERGNEYWEARELQKMLGYKEWRLFSVVIEKAQIACFQSNNSVNYHFGVYSKMIGIAKRAKRSVIDYKLSRYACYLIVQNSNPKFEAVALGQTYFAIQTRKMELTEEEYNKLTEDEKRLYRRKQTKDSNKILYRIAKEKGVKNFDRFTNAGYKGLYNGETADDIAKRKGLRYREDILDNMGSVELGANIFRITQTEALLEKQEIPSEQTATSTHYKVGKAVRDTIKKVGGTMPEDLPAPKKSLKELEKTILSDENSIEYKNK